jgi:preprotein translocase SecE subunit
MKVASKKNSFLKDCKSELLKVSFPTRQETIRATFVTIIMVIFMAVILAVFDVLFNRLMMSIMS